MRGRGGGHRLPVARVVELHVGVRRGGARRRRQLVGVHCWPLRDGLPHDAAPDQVRARLERKKKIVTFDLTRCSVRVAGGACPSSSTASRSPSRRSRPWPDSRTCPSRRRSGSRRRGAVASASRMRTGNGPSPRPARSRRGRGCRRRGNW
jgi:hypothetical protein